MLRTVLQRIEAEDAQERVWIVGPATGQVLHALVRVWMPKVILEIGTSVGYSALWMASALEQNGAGDLWTVESHAERFERARVNIEEAGLGARIHQVKGHAPEVFPELDFLEAVDLVFLDATKMEHQSYWDALRPHLRSGALLIVDNVHSHRFGAMQGFIEQMHADPALSVAEVSVGAGLLLARVR